jgi:hypothetical protein
MVCQGKGGVGKHLLLSVGEKITITFYLRCHRVVKKKILQK